MLKLIYDFIYLFLSFFSGSDPNQHILDTLEQCISVIIEKLHRLDQDKNGSRLGSMDLDKSIEGKKNISKNISIIVDYFILIHF